jgi:hypothetical protein
LSFICIRIRESPVGSGRWIPIRNKFGGDDRGGCAFGPGLDGFNPTIYSEFGSTPNVFTFFRLIVRQDGDPYPFLHYVTGDGAFGDGVGNTLAYGITCLTFGLLPFGLA